jgi:hypothetical protein
MNVDDYRLPAYGLLQEPLLAFHPDRPEDCDSHPLRGLVNYGPYSRSLINNVVDPIRVAFIVPHNHSHVIRNLLAELEQSHKPKERQSYLIDFLGFSRIMGLRIVQASSDVLLELPIKLDAEIAESKQPHLVLAEKITQAISSLETRRSSFDVLLIYLPDRWQQCFHGGDDEDFDLHDYLKAITASSAISTQILIESKTLAYHCRASVMWRLSIALYAKAGGVPWKLARYDPEVAYIGLSYAVRSSEDKPRFVTCCSQVFDSDGAGLEFLTYEIDDVHVERENPFLSRSEMRRVMARSLSLYQRKHAGRSPKHVVVHKSTEFKLDEVNGCFDAWKSSEGLDLVQVQDDVMWRGVLINPPPKGETKGVPNGYPCLRGTYIQMGGREVLLWTQGNSPSTVGGRDFYKEGKGIPRPLFLRRFAGHGGWEESCQAVLGLTKMNWNNDSLYDRLPVTMSYARVLARTVKRMPTLTSRPYEFRFFM